MISENLQQGEMAVKRLNLLALLEIAFVGEVETRRN
jgi:hypothetical protein